MSSLYSAFSVRLAKGFAVDRSSDVFCGLKGSALDVSFSEISTVVSPAGCLFGFDGSLSGGSVGGGVFPFFHSGVEY